jgi:hypothetical protein
VRRRFFKVFAAGLFFALTFPPSAAAEWHFTPTIGWTFAANTSLLDPDHGTSKVHWNFGGSVTLLGGGILGVEGMVNWTPGFFEGGDVGDEVIVRKSHTVAYMGNVMLTTPRKWTEYSLRPFVSGGFGVLGFSRTEYKNVFPDQGYVAAFNIGGGAIGFLSKRTGLRFDLRYYSNLKPSAPGSGIQEPGSGQGPISIGSAHLRYMTATVGVVIRR